MVKGLVRFLTLAFLVVSLACSLIACTCTSSGSNSANNLSTIITNETVALTTVDPDGDTLTYCAGVWVSDTTILTAAHCPMGIAELSTEIDDILKIRASLGDVNAAKEIRKILSEAAKPLDYTFITKEEYPGMFRTPDVLHHARLLAMDERHDLALLVTDENVAHMTAKLAETTPDVGEKLEFSGHPGWIAWTYVEGIVAGYREPQFRVYPLIDGPFLQVSAAIFQGNSGGGAFNERGELVGVCSFTAGHIPNAAFYIHLSTIKQFLESPPVD